MTGCEDCEARHTPGLCDACDDLAAGESAPKGVSFTLCGMQISREGGRLIIESAPEPSPPVRSTATETATPHCGIGLPDCETCDPNTDRNQDRRRRGESPVCIDCGGDGELDGEVNGRRWCQACQVTFGWMVPATRVPGLTPLDSIAHVCPSCTAAVGEFCRTMHGHDIGIDGMHAKRRALHEGDKGVGS